MSKISAKEIKNLREKTGAGVMDVRRALAEAKGGTEKAKKILKERGLEKAASKTERDTSAGLIGTYVHHDGTSGSMVHLACETDFVARTDEFKKLAKELAMQGTAMNPASADELLKQEYIRDPEKTVGELVAEVSAKTGENIQVKEIKRFSVND
jgi:elongation factor Ts